MNKIMAQSYYYEFVVAQDFDEAFVHVFLHDHVFVKKSGTLSKSTPFYFIYA